MNNEGVPLRSCFYKYFQYNMNVDIISSVQQLTIKEKGKHTYNILLDVQYPKIHNLLTANARNTVDEYTCNYNNV